MSAPKKNHYEVLGVGKTASTSDIRSAYRRCAREAHPDTAPDSVIGSAPGSITNASARMAQISQAWAVLSDPVRRRQYDAVSASETETSETETSETETSETETSETETRSETEQFVQRAQFPWRFMLVFVFVGIVVVLVLNAMSQPAVPVGPDGLLRSGSCIVIDANLTAVEVRCEDAHDGVVRQLVGFDMACPRDTEAIRDRQGMGLACVVRN